jgi:hypothetical protein
LLLIFGGQCQKALYRGVVCQCFGEAAASFDLDSRTADLIRQPMHDGVVYNARSFVGSVGDVVFTLEHKPRARCWLSEQGITPQSLI